MPPPVHTTQPPTHPQVGYCADKFNRVKLLAFIVVLGEAPCLSTYWVRLGVSWLLHTRSSIGCQRGGDDPQCMHAVDALVPAPPPPPPAPRAHAR